jgi:hypothetical protein
MIIYITFKKIIYPSSIIEIYNLKAIIYYLFYIPLKRKYKQIKKQKQKTKNKTNHNFVKSCFYIYEDIFSIQVVILFSALKSILEHINN